MTYTVQYTRYFEEFGFNDVDTKEFNNLKDAYAFYNEKINDDNVQLWVKNENDLGLGTRLH